MYTTSHIRTIQIDVLCCQTKQHWNASTIKKDHGHALSKEKGERK